MELVRVPESRDAGRGQGAENGGRPGAESRARNRAGFWRTRCARLSCGGPSSRWRASCRRRPSRRSSANWRPRNGSSTTICGGIIANRCCCACNRKGSRNRRCTFWRRCCGSARRPVIPGLLDAKRAGEPSAKLDVLLDQLDELREEGHKALVFSQFTSLLAIVRSRLDEAGVRYEYLDGATRRSAGARRGISRTTRRARCS